MRERVEKWTSWAGTSQENDDGDASILNYGGSNYDMEDIAFANVDDTVAEEDDDHNFFGNEREWYHWAPIGNYDDVPGLTMNNSTI